MARRIESHWIAGPAGRLEAILEEPENAPPLRAALVCHPHPLYGGTMHNKVVHRLARGLRTARAVVLRFNFRGVGQSHGSHAHGEGELDDARVALDWLRARYPDLSLVLAGFSFGARVVTRLGCEVHPGRLIAVGFPTRGMDTTFLGTCPVDKVFVQSAHDEHGPRAELDQLFEKFSEPKRLIYVEARDHFFDGGLDELERTVIEL